MPTPPRPAQRATDRRPAGPAAARPQGKPRAAEAPRQPAGRRWWPVRLSVRSQLILGFLSVAVLAVAANLLLQRDGTAIRTRVETLAPTPTAAAPAAPTDGADATSAAAPITAAAANAAQAPIVRESARAAAARRKLAAAPTPDALLVTLQVFNQRVLAGIESGGAAADALADASRGLELAGATERFALEASRAGARRATLSELREVLRRHESAGLELIRTAGRRRDLLGAYQTRIDALGADVAKPLDASFKLFGRIYAREPIIALNQSFAELRDRQAVLAGAPRFTDASMQSAAGAEVAFEEALNSAEAGLPRAQGGTWILELRGRLADVTAARQTVTRLDDEQALAVQAFVAESRSIDAAIRSIARRIVREGRAAAAAPAVTGRAAPAAPLPEPMTVDDAAALLALPLPAPAVRTITERISTESATSLSMLWVSIVVLGLMLVATIGTVFGVTNPVRRLTAATRRLARGEVEVSVPRGGARELDELGEAFNEMARELAGARAALERQQQRLEQEVAERTRDLQHLAENDPLTQLPNRRRLFRHLSTAIERASAAAGGSVAVMFLDVDNFKTINDSLNHEFGDEVLRQISARLRNVIGADGFCARLGGDEFTVVVEGPLTLEDIAGQAASLIRAFEPPLRLRDEDLRVTVSLGVSKFPEHAADAEGLLRAADTALFRSKERGRNQYAVFDQDMQSEAARKFEVEQGLHAAIQRGELRLAFQPEVELGTLEAITVEALLRWQRPDGRLVAPGEFLAVAEQSRLILDIGDWVMREAIRTLAEWRRGPWPEARIAVNVSARQLLDGRFAEGVAALLIEHGVPPQALEIELTESVLQTGPQTVASLRALRHVGVSIALDDFGTGYSSLASLEQLPLTRVKLDRSLVAAIDTRERSRSIARSIIGLCRGLGLAVTAEGVERSTQLALLAEEPGVTVQGFLLSRPVPAEEWLRLLPTLAEAMQSHLLDLPLAPLPSARPREGAAAAGGDPGRVSYG